MRGGWEGESRGEEGGSERGGEGKVRGRGEGGGEIKPRLSAMATLINDSEHKGRIGKESLQHSRSAMAIIFCCKHLKPETNRSSSVLSSTRNLAEWIWLMREI